MNPSDQKTFWTGDGNAVVLEVGLWAACDGVRVRVDMTGDGTPTTITNRPGAVGKHRILFRDVRRMLLVNGCWISGDEGADVQEDESTED